MIKVIINKSGNIINKVTIKGHSGYEEAGKDIVCAAVSSTVLTTVNAILDISNEAINYEEKDIVTVTIIKHDEIIDKLINNMIAMLKQMENEYAKYIKIIEEAS